MKIISLTGTKGKTTITRMLDEVLKTLAYETLRVDTDGHYVNGRQKSNYHDSKKYWGIVPNVCPGRFLYEVKNMDYDYTVAILEAAIGSSSLTGMGYSRHDIGIFTNVFEDHITKKRIKNRDDIYTAKRFIFERLAEDGTFIYNCDDEFLTEKLEKEKFKNKVVAVGKTLSLAAQEKFFQTGNVFVKINSEDEIKIVYPNAANVSQEIAITGIATYPITFEGKFLPNIYNVAFVYAALFVLLGDKAFKEKLFAARQALAAYTPSKKGGRLVMLRNKKKNITILIDFAHEKESLKQVANLAKHYSKNRVVGVLRLDPSRVDEDVFSTAKYIADAYDHIYIYDKIDGIKATESWLKAEGKKRGVGETAGVFAKGLEAAGYKNFEIILQESKALEKAYRDSQIGDVLIFIGQGDDHAQSYELAKKIINS